MIIYDNIYIYIYIYIYDIQCCDISGNNKIQKK